MAAAGLPVPAADHADRIAGMALDMIEVTKRISKTHDVSIEIRIGIASGPVLAGVIGAKRLIYDVWGETVNLASRLENHSQPQGILVSELTYVRLRDGYDLAPHGSIDVKGYGVVQAWLLKGRQASRRPMADPADAPLDTLHDESPASFVVRSEA